MAEGPALLLRNALGAKFWVHVISTKNAAVMILHRNCACQQNVLVSANSPFCNIPVTR